MPAHLVKAYNEVFLQIELSFGCKAMSCPLMLIAATTVTVKPSYFFVTESCGPAFALYNLHHGFAAEHEVCTSLLNQPNYA